MKSVSPGLGILVAISLAALFLYAGRDTEEAAPPPKDEIRTHPKQVSDLESEFASLPERVPARRTIVRSKMLALLQETNDPRVAIREALAHRDENVKWAGLLVFDYYGTADSEAAKHIADALSNDRPAFLQLEAAKAAGRVTPEDFATVRQNLLHVASNGNRPYASDHLLNQARRAAVATLSSRAVEDPTSLRWLAALLSDEDNAIRESAAYGFSQFEYSERLSQEDVAAYMPLLRKSLGDPVASVRSYALMALGRMGRAAAPAVQDMAALINDDDVLVRRTCLTALGGIGAPAISSLAAGLDRCSDDEVASYMHALYMVGDDADDALQIASSHERAVVRVHALIKRWERSARVEDVLASLAKELDAPLDQAHAHALLQAARGLGRMGTAAKQSLPVLRRARTRVDEVLAGTTTTDVPRERVERIRAAIDAAIKQIDR